nr:uncharacterized protein LOC109184657 [Ipomoea batatas]
MLSKEADFSNWECSEIARTNRLTEILRDAPLRRLYMNQQQAVTQFSPSIVSSNSWSRSMRVVPNSTSESTVPTISKGQLTDTVPIQSLPFQQYPTNMIWSIPSSRNSLSSFNEYSYHITGNTSQPMMVDVVANNKMKHVGSTQSQVQSTNTLPGLSSESMPIMNGVYDPMYEELGLPVDPHLRLRMLSKEADFFNWECSEIRKQVDRFCEMLRFVAFTESTTRPPPFDFLPLQPEGIRAPSLYALLAFTLGVRLMNWLVSFMLIEVSRSELRGKLELSSL